MAAIQRPAAFCAFKSFVRCGQSRQFSAPFMPVGSNPQITRSAAPNAELTDFHQQQTDGMTWIWAPNAKGSYISIGPSHKEVHSYPLE